MNTLHDKHGRFTYKLGYKPVKFSNEAKSARKLAKKLIDERNKEDADQTK